MPKELAKSLAVHDFNDDESASSVCYDAVEKFPAFFDPNAYHHCRLEKTKTIAADFLLIEQFIVSLMFDAVLVMLKAGYPHTLDLGYEFVVGIRCRRGTILEWALKVGAVDVVRYLHTERGVDVLLRRDNATLMPEGLCMSLGRPFEVISVHSNTSKMPLVKFFVEELGVNPHHRIGCSGLTALHVACKNTQYETAVYLIENQNMNVRTKDSYGDDALDYLNLGEPSDEEEEDWSKLRLYLEERAESEKSAYSFKAYVCPCEKCVARQAVSQQQMLAQLQEQESEDEDDE